MRGLRILVHHALAFAAGLLRRIVNAIWMFKPPAFCREWQDLPPPTSPQPHPKPAKPSSGAVSGALVGMLVETAIPASEIIRVLPRGLALPDGVKPADLYPVSLAFGFQDDVKPARFSFLPGADYLEFAVGVADLRLVDPVDGFAGPCAILGRLDLNELLPIILGRLLGLEKMLRGVTTTDTTFHLRTFLSGSAVAHGSIRPLGPPRPVADVPSLASFIRTFEQPVVSRSMLGSLAFTGFTWHWDQGWAADAQVDVTIELGLGGGRYTFPSEAGVAPTCTGAWQIRVPWTMQPFQSPGSFTATAGASRPRG